MKKTCLEFIVGLFLAIGIGCLAWMSIKLARKEFFATGSVARLRFHARRGSSMDAESPNP